MNSTAPDLSVFLDALGCSWDEPPVVRLLQELGGEPSLVRERLVGEPPIRSRRLGFPDGVEVIAHDEVVEAVVLWLVPTGMGAAAQLGRWIPGVDNQATLDEVRQAFGESARFSGFGQPYSMLGGGFLTLTFASSFGMNNPGNLRQLVFSRTEPSSIARPELDDCPSCSDLLVRDDTGAMDLSATIEALQSAVASKELGESFHWVPLADFRLLVVSELMDRVESQFDCKTCGRIIALSGDRGESPTFTYLSHAQMERRPMGLIPPVEQWGDEERLRAEREAMHYVDHQPGGWFLVEYQGDLYLDARYAWNGMVDDSALIKLNEDESADHRARGPEAIAELAQAIADRPPYREESPWHGRDLFRESEGEVWRKLVRAAIVNHTWIAQQRRR